MPSSSGQEVLGGLRALVIDFFLTDSWRDCARLVALHPVLLTEEADAVFGTMIYEAPDDRARTFIGTHRELLRQARPHGLDQALLNYEISKTPNGLQEDVGYVMEQLVTFVNTPRGERLEVLSASPLLLHHAIPNVVRDVTSTLDSPEQVAAVHAAGRLLERARQVGGLRALAEEAVERYLRAQDENAMAAWLISLPELREPLASEIMTALADNAPPDTGDQIRAALNYWKRFIASYTEGKVLDLRTLDPLLEADPDAAVTEFLAAADAAGMLRVLLARPVLLEADTMVSFTERIRVAAEADDVIAAVRCARRMLITIQATDCGAEQAVAETAAIDEDELTEAVAAFANAFNVPAFRGLVVTQPLLLEPIAAEILDIRGVTRQPWFGDILRRCRELGVEAAFAGAGAQGDGSESTAALRTMASQYAEEYQRTGRTSDLVTAAVLQESRIGCLPPDATEERSAAHGYAGELRLALFFRTRSVRDLKRGIGSLAAALPGSSPYERRNIDRLNYASALREHAALGGEPGDLVRAIELLEEALGEELTEPGLRDRVVRLLVTILVDRGQAGKSVADLDRAADVIAGEIAQSPEEPPGWLASLLGDVAISRWELTRREQDLLRLLEIRRQEVQQAPGDFEAQLALAAALDKAFRENIVVGEAPAAGHAGRPGFNEAAEAIRAASDAASDDEQKLRAALAWAELQSEHVTVGGASAETAVQAAGQALRMARNADSSRLDHALMVAARAFAGAYRAQGDPADLRRAQDRLAEAEGLPYESELSQGLDHERIEVLRLIFQLTGDQAVLNQAIDLAGRELAEGTRGASGRRLLDLSLLYVERFRLTGQLSDLDRAAEAAERGLDQEIQGTWNWRALAVALANRLTLRAQITVEISDADLAVTLLRKVVSPSEGNPEADDRRARSLTNLGNALTQRYMLTGHLPDLEEGAAVMREAAELTGRSSPYLPRRLFNYANAVQFLAQDRNDPAAADQALALFQEAARLVPNPVYRTLYTMGVLSVLTLKFRRFGTEQAGAELISQFGQFLQADPAPREAVRAASMLGSIRASRGEWEPAVSAYRQSLDVLAVALRREPLRGQKETWLHEAAGLPARLAEALIRTGDSTQAVEALERGRVVLLAQALERSVADVARLRDSGHEELAAQWESLTRRIETLEAAELSSDEHLRTGVFLSEKVTLALSEQMRLLQTIRQLPGQEGFLREDDVHDCVTEGRPQEPLIYLASTDETGFALIVRGPRDVTPVWLPDLTDDRVLELVQALHRVTSATPDDQTAAVVRQIVDWLKTAALGPLTGILCDVDQAVFVPAGLLSRLPLHAAAALAGISVSYAPSARVLAVARRHTQPAAPVRALVVADPADTGYPPLTGARLEADIVAAVFPGSQPPLTGAAATRAAVKDRVRSSGLVHIASHGFAALSSPLDSGLVMAGGEVLTARDLTAERLEARLVVLSACESGLPGAALPDEVVGLPTSFLYAGAAGVLATMWQVPDDDALIFTVSFYDAWRRRGLTPAAACAAACAWLRTTTDGTKLEYFAGLMSAQEGWLPPKVAQRCWERLILNDPQERTHGDPYLWGAFAYDGA